MIITRFKAKSVQLDFPTGSELGNKRIGKPILNLQNCLSWRCHCLSGRCHCLSGGSHSDNKASLSSSETVLELPTGTELGKNYIQNKFLDWVGPYPPHPLWGIGLTCIQIIQEVHRPNFNCNCACKILKVYLSGWCHCLSGWCHCLSGGWCHCLSGRCHCLSGGSHSDNKASLSSSDTVLELPTGTELGNNKT